MRPPVVVHVYDPDHAVDPHAIRTRDGTVVLHLVRGPTNADGIDVVTVGPDGVTAFVCVTECGCP